MKNSHCGYLVGAGFVIAAAISAPADNWLWGVAAAWFFFGLVADFTKEKM